MKTKCFLVAANVTQCRNSKSSYTDITVRVDGVYSFSDLHGKEISIDLPERVQSVTKTELIRILKGLDFTESQKATLKAEIFNK